MRYLGIDPGDKRVGLAVGDNLTRIATPLGLIRTSNREEQLHLIGNAIQEQGIETLIVGLPLNMDGTEGDAARRSRMFANELRKRFGLPVELVDERLSSRAADIQLAETGLSHNEKQRPLHRRGGGHRGRRA